MSSDRLASEAILTEVTHPVDMRLQTSLSFWRWLPTALSFASLIVVVNQVLDLRLFGFVIIQNSYFYVILAFYVSLAFLFFPLRKGAPARRFLWLDVFLFLLTFGLLIYFAWHGQEIAFRGWGYRAPPRMVVMSIVLWALILEAVRRTGGKTLLIVISFFSFYPLFASYMPGLLGGPGRTLSQTAIFHLMSGDSLVGIPTRIVAELLIGFMFFGIALQATGGGKFFLNLASCLMGNTIGGTAKIAVLASALFGSISGSSVGNVLATGSFTIPAMKKAGFPPEQAGAIEACASTGGVLMPPIMGAVAFVMAAFLGIPYSSVAIAAALPSVLYYFGLLIQVDAFARKQGVGAIPRSEIPPLRKVLIGGWLYLFAMAVLIYFLFVERMVGQAPFYATAVLLIASTLRKETRFTLRSFLQFIEDSGRFLAQLGAIMAGVGFILGSLTFTGVAASLARELVVLGGGNVVFMLILGALASLILGMGMAVTAVYVFLAVTLAPALTMMGYNPLAVHLFVLYWAMIANITPPVASAAIVAASLAGASVWKVGITAMRLGAVIYFIPFLFVLDPALVLQAGIGEALYAFFTAAIGMFLIGSGLQGYLLGLGGLEFGKPAVGYLLRVGLIVSGILLGLSGWQSDVLGVAIALVILSPMLLIRFRAMKIKSKKVDVARQKTENEIV